MSITVFYCVRQYLCALLLVLVSCTDILEVISDSGLSVSLVRILVSARENYYSTYVLLYETSIDTPLKDCLRL